jgi:hypothetical protein
VLPAKVRRRLVSGERALIIGTRGDGAEEKLRLRDEARDFETVPAH